MRVTRAAAWGLTAALTVVGGCGGDGDDDATGDDAAADAPPVRSCDLITVEEVNALIGSPVTRGPDRRAGFCDWLAETTGGIGIGLLPAQHRVGLRVLEPPVSTLDGMMTTGDDEPEPIADLGDEAQLVVTSPNATSPAVTAGYIDGDLIVTLTYEVMYAEDDVDLRPKADTVVELLRRVDRRATGS